MMNSHGCTVGRKVLYQARRVRATAVQDETRRSPIVNDVGMSKCAALLLCECICSCRKLSTQEADGVGMSLWGPRAFERCSARWVQNTGLSKVPRVRLGTTPMVGGCQKEKKGGGKGGWEWRVVWRSELYKEPRERAERGSVRQADEE